MSWIITGTFAQPDEPEALAYIAAVEAADGEVLEDGVKFAYNSFIKGCKQDGIWDAIKASCILAGARTLAGALVPLVGTAPTNYNFVAGDYDRKTGLKGNGSSKGLDSNRANNADPRLSNHNAVYVTALDTVTGAATVAMAADGTASGRNNLGFSTTYPNLFYRNRNSTAVVVSGGQNVTGLFGMDRSSSSEIKARFSGSTQTLSLTADVAANSSNVLLYNRVGASYTDARLSFYSIGESLDLALLDARVTTLMSALAAAIP